MRVKSRRAFKDAPQTWESENPTRDTVRVKWVRTDWYWGPECPVNSEHGCLIDIQGGENWYCRHQSHDNENLRAVFSESQLQDYAWARYLASLESDALASQGM
jgi:hypothetical protein